MEKNDLINKFIQIESWAWKGRHCIDQGEPDIDNARFTYQRIRRELEELEILLKVDR